MPSAPIREFLEMDVFMGNEPEAEYTGLTSRCFLPFFGTLAGGFCSLASNMGRMRPAYAGLQGLLLHLVIGCAFGEGVYRVKEWKNSRKDAILRHYIDLHPEEFLTDDRPKYKDVFEQWIPVR